MERSTKFWLIAGGAAFWGAVLLAFWLGTRLSRNDTDSASSGGGSAADAGSTRPAGSGKGTQVTSHTGGTPGGNPTGPGTVAGPTGAGTQPGQPEGAPQPIGEDLGARDFAPGEVVELNYEFASEQARREYEADRKAQWERRKGIEIERIGAYLTRELKLDSMQSARLKALLEDESRRRMEVVSDLTDGRIDQLTFRRRVDEIRTTARTSLDSIFTPEQMAHYKTLEPRKQVLLDGPITGR